MVKFQISKNRKTGQERGSLSMPKALYKQRGWRQGTELAMTEGVDGSLIFREVRK